MPSLERYGFRFGEAFDSHRGAKVTVVNRCVAVSVTADWLEGELYVSVSAHGGPEVALAEIVDLTQAKGLALSRLRRGASVGILEARLRKVGEVLVAQVAELLDCSPTHVERLRNHA